MRAWETPDLPAVPGRGTIPHITNSSDGELHPSATDSGTAGLYVCGITPYDATHMGHAATYVNFDLLLRAWRDAGLQTTYVQNVTDVDDPLLERAHATGVDWKALAERETQLFRDDMSALRVLPPDSYLGATETVPWVVQAVEELVDRGAAYRVPVTDGTALYPDNVGDVYFDISTDPHFGDVSGWTHEQMMQIFPERGGDPDRAGKRQPLDPLLWRMARQGEPAWDGHSLGHGRPGWHIECVAIALRRLERPFDVNGGGSDLVFPHHEMGASHAHVLTGTTPYARTHAHGGMVGLDGEKMSKSKGNLVLVSRLRAAGEDPMAIRLAILAHHYRTDWSWTDDILDDARARLTRWRTAAAGGQRPGDEGVVAAVRECIARDLDAPGALAVVDEWAGQDSAGTGGESSVVALIDALLGIRL